MKKATLEGVVPAPAGLEAAPSPDKRRFSFNTSADARRIASDAATRIKASLPSIPLFNEKPVVIDARSIRPLQHRENTPRHALNDTISTINIRPSVLRKTSDHEGFSRLRGDVFMLGGYRGSVLRDTRTGKRIWAPVRTALGLRTADLSIGLTDAEELKSAETVVAEKMLTTLAGVVEMGRALKVKLNTLEKSGHITFHNWGFDWRRNLDLSSADLLAAVNEAHRRSGRGVTIIAHSMGGLVALHALARAADPRAFARILFVGTPFQGCPNALGPLRWGDVLGRNADICSPKAVFSMRSTYYFLPPKAYQCFELEDGTPIETDLFSLDDWSKFGFSPLARDVLSPGSTARAMALRTAQHAAIETDEDGQAPDSDDESTVPIAPSLSSATSPSSRSIRRFSVELDPEATPPVTPKDDPAIADYLKRTLTRVQRFRADLIDLYDPSKAELYPKLGIIASSTTATVRGVRVEREEDVIAGDFSRLLFDHGDGIVLHKSATQLPGQWYKHLRTTESSSYGHVSLLSDLDVVDRALSKLI